MSSFTLDSLSDARGATVYDSSGDKIGAVEEIFYDETTQQPEWIGLGTGFFGTKRVLVPVHGLEPDADGFRVPYAKSKVKGSPDVASDDISESLERELYSYYGVQRSERRSDTGLPAGGTRGDYDTGIGRTPAPGPDSAGDVETGTPSVTRSEEEVRVGKEQVQSGQVRLRKWVETEQVQVPVELRKEKVAVERQALDEPISREEIGEEETEITLTEERPVVEKKAVAKERVTVGKDVEREERTIGEEVRRERVDVDADDDRDVRRR